MKKQLKLGMMVKDSQTDFTGFAIQELWLINGTHQFAVQPKLDKTAKPGDYPDGMNIDVDSLDWVSDGISNRSAAPDTSVSVQLGDEVEDIVTGLVGIALTKVQFINGCVYFQIQNKAEKNLTTGLLSVLDPVQLPHQRLKILKKSVIPGPAPVTPEKPRTGGPSTRMTRG